ncbi:ATP-dependent RNA helicase abstrakt [Phytophthora citrophthora]|uniref:ATP-dependent RNA helicase abstrakt n=1 Tax=Phytophthora citrophthora TaxID=4793 RepID=A0AAD9H045_9STRA|nr:ATP-dependent RNA helicase abstrakt [Phytophthora citrophthora]
MDEYVPRRKRRRAEPTVTPPAPKAYHSVDSSIREASATQETLWLRQERGIVVEGEGPIPTPIRSFQELSLPPDVISVLHSRGVSTPSAIQAQTLPCVYQRRDVVALAPTGSGKTLCYILPMLGLLRSQLYPDIAAYPTMPTLPYALVIVPTRELVDQVVQDLVSFFPKSPNPPIVGICGGIPVDEQLAQLRQHTNNAVAVVATPGRLLHLAQRHGSTLSLGQVSLFVVDEVDRILEAPEMETQLREILQLSDAPGRQTLLLSATLPAFLPRLARSAVLRPITIRVEEANLSTQLSSTSSSAMMLALSTSSNVVHDVQFMRPAEKHSRLLSVLRATKQPPVLVFCNSRLSVERVGRFLRNEQFHVAPLHGGQSQGYRTQVLRLFRAGYVDVLVATDLASRGLDLPGVEHVVLFDMPHAIEDYVHRCGRTGRHPGGDTGGSDVSGKATSFLTRECAIAVELKEVLRAAKQSLPRELEVPRLFRPLASSVQEQ